MHVNQGSINRYIWQNEIWDPFSNYNIVESKKNPKPHTYDLSPSLAKSNLTM